MVVVRGVSLLGVFTGPARLVLQLQLFITSASLSSLICWNEAQRKPYPVAALVVKDATCHSTHYVIKKAGRGCYL